MNCSEREGKHISCIESLVTKQYKMNLKLWAWFMNHEVKVLQAVGADRLQTSKFNSVWNIKSYIYHLQKTVALHSFLNVQSNRTTGSSDIIIILQRSSVCSCLKVTDKSFTNHAPVLWNSLFKQLWHPSLRQSLGTTADSAPLYLPSPASISL